MATFYGQESEPEGEAENEADERFSFLWSAWMLN